MSNNEADFLKTAYTEAGNNFRKLTEIRFQLLTLLPAGTVGAIAILATRSKDAYDRPLIPQLVAVLGAIFTIALWVYDQRNNQLYNELVGQAAHLERRMRDGSEVRGSAGPFADRPRETSELLSGLKFEHRWPVVFIYAACFSSWVIVLFTTILDDIGYDSPVICALFAVMVVAAVTWAIRCLNWRTKRQELCLREQVTSAMSALVANLLANSNEDEHLKRLRNQIGPLFSDDPSALEMRLNYHFLRRQGAASTNSAAIDSTRQRGLVSTKRDLTLEDASRILNEITDLPARWILDVYSGRRAVSGTIKKPSYWRECALFFGALVLTVVLLWFERPSLSASSSSGGQRSADSIACATCAATMPSASASSSPGCCVVHVQPNTTPVPPIDASRAHDVARQLVNEFRSVNESPWHKTVKLVNWLAIACLLLTAGGVVVLGLQKATGVAILVSGLSGMAASGALRTHGEAAITRVNIELDKLAFEFGKRLGDDCKSCPAPASQPSLTGSRIVEEVHPASP